MKTEQLDEYTLTYDDSPEAHKRIFDMALTWFKKVECFSGESIQQSDGPLIDGPNFLSVLAEDGFRFETEWKE